MGKKEEKIEKRKIRYSVDIYQALCGVFDQELDIDEGVDLVEFFTALSKAGTLLLQELSGLEKSHFEFTQFLQTLIVADIAERGAKVEFVELEDI